MTPERALTALTQARSAMGEARNQLAEAMQVMSGLSDRTPCTFEDAEERATRLLRVPRVLWELDRMRGELHPIHD
jgi:hypothetical protein